MVVACIYHWYMAGLYASPVLLIGGWVWFSGRRNRGRRGGPPEGQAPAAGGPAPSAS
jgi:hypothetical protein